MSVNDLSQGDLNTGALQLGKRPAVVAVDFSNGFTNAESPLGGNFDAQINATRHLVKVAKEHGVPIFFTTVVYENSAQASVFRQRLPALNMLEKGSHWVDIHNNLVEYLEEDGLVEKQFPSAFFGTDLAQKLEKLNIDSLIITGLTTSGCVRATCVDALQYNYVSIVVDEACGDRNLQAHDMSLHDMHAKYAQVMSLEQTLHWLNTL
jgi:maleamate amidohydrolase